MNLSLAAKSLVLFGVSILFLVVLTLFESSLVSLPERTERGISALLLIVPAVAGALFGVLSLRQKEMKTGTAIAGITLNALFALFHIFVLSFAG